MSNVPPTLTDLARARIGSRIRGKWHVDRLLGVGGMGSVYAATHRNGSRVALKVLHPTLSLDPDIRARFAREGYAANSVGHPGVVRVIDDDETEDGAAFLVMDLLEGETADTRAKRLGGRLPIDEVVRIVTELCDVLAAAHAVGIVHRDIKPDNVFLAKDGSVKVLDFGIARLREGALAREGDSADARADRLKTRTGVTIGTPAFMPPEQAMGRIDEVDALSDVWAVGATAFMLLSGRIVHDGSTHMEVVIAAATAQARKLAEVAPGVPASVAAVIDRALAFKKEDRWPSASAMKKALEAARGALARSPTTDGPTSAIFAAAPMSSHPSPSPTWLEERRLATVVFAELEGLEHLGLDLEPDAARELMNAYLAAVVAEVEREGGTMVKHLGETALAVFGVPKSREDDAARAVRAALAMVGRTAELARSRREDVTLRAGIHTGVIMVGSVATTSAAPDVSGAAVSLASRLAHAAPRGAILVGPATEPLVRDAFHLDEGPSLEVKGSAEPVRARVVVGEREGPASSLRLRSASGTSFFARQRELEAVLAQYDLVDRGGGLRVVEITGEVGLGKGYLLRQLRAALEARPRKPCIMHASRPFQTAPVGFLARVLRAHVSPRSEDQRETLAARVRAAVESAWEPGSADGREAGRVLSALAAPEPASALLHTELAGGDGTLAASTLAAWLRRLAERSSVVVMVEQVDWTDSAVLEQLAVLVRALRKSAVFLVFTSRPNAGEELPAWLTGCEVRARVELAPFPPDVMERFVDDLFRNVPAFPREIKRDIVARAEGNPEMCRQLVRLLVDRGAVTVDAQHVPIGWDSRRSTKLTLPDTVRGILQARIDGLTMPQKEVLKLASVVGRVFWLGALAAAAGPAVSEEELLSVIDALRARDLVRPQATASLAGEREYTFGTQALRDAAYELVPRAAAVSIHKKIAEWLGGRGDPWEGAQAELAMHLEAAGEHARSRRLYLAAARRAIGQSAHVEAVENLRRALAGWRDDVPAGERIDRAGVRREKAAAEAKIGRFDDALASLDAAEADLRAAGVPAEDAAHAWIALERGLVLKEYGRIDPSMAALDAGIALATRITPGMLHVRLHSARAFQLAAKGRIDEAKADLAEGRRIGEGFNVRDTTWHLAMARLEDAEGLVHVHAGDLEAAARSYRTALEHREQAGDAQGVQDAYVNLGGVAFSRGDFAAAIGSYEKALASAKKMRWPSREALGYGNLGQARLAAGDATAAVADLDKACRMAEDGGYLDVLADASRALAEAHLTLGAVDVALEEAGRAIAHAERAKSPYFVAMAHATKMDALLLRLRLSPERATLEAATSHRDAACAVLREQRQERLAAQIEGRFVAGSAGTVASAPS